MLRCQKACNAPEDDSRTINDIIGNLTPESIKITLNIVTKVADGMTQSSEGTHHKQDGLVFLLI